MALDSSLVCHPIRTLSYLPPDTLPLSGRLVTDTVQLGDLTITQQGMGAALLSAGFETVDGILG